mmetsp:Transcript_32875/g.49605  ORF Transcript_32875/g.49605 Transcript_32875/m.49605 type:complete len:227 (-) Transcript_32875:246-926(-)
MYRVTGSFILSLTKQHSNEILRNTFKTNQRERATRIPFLFHLEMYKIVLESSNRSTITKNCKSTRGNNESRGVDSSTTLQVVRDAVMKKEGGRSQPQKVLHTSNEASSLEPEGQQHMDQRMDPLGPRGEEKSIERLQEKIMKIALAEASHATLPTMISCSECSSTACSWAKCVKCSKKDRIIQRQQADIQSLRQQLKHVALQTSSPPEELYCDGKVSLDSDITTLL